MDLRTVKTKKAIREAFLQLRTSTQLEKIRVREICRIAMINKSTFYHHYADVFALSDELENEILHDCIAAFAYTDQFFSDPRTFLRNLPQAVAAYQEPLQILFRDRQEILYIKLEKQLRSFYSKPGQTAQEEILLAFLIGGAMRAMETLKSEGKYSDEVLIQNLADIIEKLREK